MRMHDDLEENKKLKNKIAELEEQLRHREQILQEKEKKIRELWDLVQFLRLSNRIKRSFSSISRVAERLLNTSVLLLGYCRVSLQIRYLILKQKTNKIPRLPHEPLISIIIVNHNGKNYLRSLLKSISANTSYRNYEILIVDNNSSDDSVEFLNQINNPKIRIIENKTNLSFSEANNCAVKSAKGEILLFLNNDIIVLPGWLSHMVHVYFSKVPDKVGVVGSLLLYPGDPKIGTLIIQHAGVGFRREPDFIRPVNLDTGMKLRDRSYGTAEERIALTAACILVSKSRFAEAGGFDESYLYGYEDVDFCLKLYKSGYKNYLAGNSILFHDESATQNKTAIEEVEKRRKGNAAVFKMQWFGFLHDSELS